MFGVCVGMQVLFEGSDEDAEPGLGVLRGPGRAADGRREGAAHGVEHDDVDRARTPTSTGFPTSTRFYFVHSYAPPPAKTTVATTHLRRHVRRGGRPRQRVRDAVPPGEVRRCRSARVRAVREVARMIVIPAIDLRGGRAVRLLQGDPDDRDDLRRRPGRGRGALPRGRRPAPARRRPRRRARRGRQPRARRGDLPRGAGAGAGRRRHPLARRHRGRCWLPARSERSSAPRRRPTRRSCAGRSRSTPRRSWSRSTCAAAT